MRTTITIFFIMISSLGLAQQEDRIAELSAQEKALRSQIKVLEDSLQLVRREIQLVRAQVEAAASDAASTEPATKALAEPKVQGAEGPIPDAEISTEAVQKIQKIESDAIEVNPLSDQSAFEVQGSEGPVPDAQISTEAVGKIQKIESDAIEVNPVSDQSAFEVQGSEGPVPDAQISTKAVQKIQKVESDAIEVTPNVGSLYAKKAVVMIDRPHHSGKPIQEVQQGTRLLKIDELKKYYLVCLSGQCGYIQKEALGKTSELE